MTFGQEHGARGEAARASRTIQKAINPHRAPGGVLGLDPDPDMKEARRRYEEEHPSRLRWLFKPGEWIGRHFLRRG